MKVALIVICTLVVTFFASLDTASLFAEQPPELDLVFQRLLSDPVLTNFTKQVSKLQGEMAHYVERLLEFDFTQHKISRLNEILVQCKTIRTSRSAPLLTKIENQIATSLAKPTFLKRLYLEKLRIETTSYDRGLMQIAQEIVDNLSDAIGVGRHINYYYSQFVALALEVVQVRYFEILKIAFEVEDLQFEKYSRTNFNSQFKFLNESTQAAVENNLRNIIYASNIAHQVLSTVYHAEVVRLRAMENQQLNLLQRIETEMRIDLFQAIPNLIAKYEQAFLHHTSTHSDDYYDDNYDY